MSLPDPERSHVVLIGASRYADENLPDLPAADKSISDLALPDSEWAEPEFTSLEYDKLRGAVLDSPADTKVIVLVLGADHEDRLRTAAIGEAGEAVALLKEVTAARERVLGPDHPHTRRARHDLDALAERQPRNGDV